MFQKRNLSTALLYHSLVRHFLASEFLDGVGVSNGWGVGGRGNDLPPLSQESAYLQDSKT